MAKSRELIAYLETLVVTQGPRAGENLKVLPWQRKFIRGFLANQVSALSVGRGNGKTTLLAGIAAAALDGPLAKPRGECLLVAGSFSQAKTAFDHILNFLPSKPKYRVHDTANNAEIVDRDTGTQIKVHGMTARLIHSRAPALILADEPSSWQHTQAGSMVAGLLTGLGKIKDGRACFLGTRPSDSGHFFERLLQANADFSTCYATSKALLENKPFTLKAIKQANPSLSHMPDLLKAIRKDGERGKKDASMLPYYLAYRLNGGVPDTVESVLLEVGTWQRIEGNADPKGPCLWGIDLGGSAAQSAITCFWPQTGRMESVAAFPEKPTLTTRGTNDGVGSLYEVCYKRGELIIAGQYTTNIPELLRVALARWGKPSRLVCDRYRLDDLKEACASAEIPLTAIETRGMGFIDGAADVRQFRRACLDGDVVPVESLLLRSAMAAARTKSDPAGNHKLAKAGEGKRQGARDDAIAAAILAVSSGVREAPRPKPIRYFKV